MVSKEPQYNNSMSKPFDTGKIFDASKFYWDRNRGIVDASELGLSAGNVPYSCVYYDAYDVGMILHNPKKGTHMDFFLVAADESGWYFKSVDGNVFV